MKFNGTVNPIDYASAISWRRVNIGDPVFRELAASKLDPGARLPTDATSLLNMALSTFGPLDLEFILSELGATVFPQTQNERVVAAVKLISNRKPSLASNVTVTVPSACDGVKKVRNPTSLLGHASVSKAKVGSTVSGRTQKTSCSLKSKLASKPNVAVKDIKPDDTIGGLKRNCIGKSSSSSALSKFP